METKICTYTEKDVRLQLVRVQEPGSSVLSLELRFNRKVIARYSCSEGMIARYRFSHIVQEIVVLRDSSIMSKIT